MQVLLTQPDTTMNSYRNKTYSVKEIFYTLQGEGAYSGRAAVFCRFTGCNLWSGREKDRGKAICQFCDTDFIGTDGAGGGTFSTGQALAASIKACWKDGSDSPERPFVVLTGGEPMLQVDPPLIEALHAAGILIAIETNGTIPVPESIDWICVSPKAGTVLLQRAGNELKVVIPQTGMDMDSLGKLEFEHFFVQPMDGVQYAENCRTAVAFCMKNPQWRISTQTHKHLQIA